MTPWQGFSEEYLEHLAHLVAKRLDCSIQEFIDAEPTTPFASRFFAECCCAYPCSCTYISDYYTKQNAKIPFESFDDLFIRQAGDCEDLSKAICKIFEHIRFSTWTRPLALAMQKISKLYLACSILGAVARPSYAGAHSGGGTDVAAHMFVQLIPQYMMNQWCPSLQLDSHATHKDLRILVCEGTGHVCPNFFNHHDEHHTSLVLSSCNFPSNIERMSYPKIQNSFYKMNIHAYTNTLFRLGQNIGHFTFMKNGTYGVPFRDCMHASTDISLHPHPGLPASIRPLVDAILKHEHPSPGLSIPGSFAPIAQPFFNSLVAYTIGKSAPETQTTDFYIKGAIPTREEQTGLARLAQAEDIVQIQCFQEKFTPDHENTRVRVWVKV